MVNADSRRLAVIVGAAVVVAAVLTSPGRVPAVEVGQPAPDFKLASTTGGEVSLAAFRGRKWVLLEFYGADFAPT